MNALRPIEDPTEIEKCFRVMKELRPHLSLAEFLRLTDEARKRDEYRLIGYYEGDECLAVMGYRILFDLVHGKHLYIDDLVVTESRRSQGIGAVLLKHAEKIAPSLECKSLRLCTGIQNEGGKKFYERNDWLFRSVVYKKKL